MIHKANGSLFIDEISHFHQITTGFINNIAREKFSITDNQKCQVEQW